jgi:hypothetical protein
MNIFQIFHLIFSKFEHFRITNLNFFEIKQKRKEKEKNQTKNQTKIKKERKNSEKRKEKREKSENGPA